MKSSSQTKGAITLTIASVTLFSGLWGLWYTPTSTYEPRRNEQIMDLEFILSPKTDTFKGFEVDEDLQEIRLSVWGETIIEDYDPAQDQNPPNVLPIFAVRIFDPQGKIVTEYDNVTSVGEGDRITISALGTYKVEAINKSDKYAEKILVRLTDVTKIANHPLEATGQWLTIISLPMFGLGSVVYHQNEDDK
jgi:hypothetical protein